MDNNNLNQPVVPPVAPQPVPPVTPLVVPPASGGSKKMLMIVVLAFVAVAILLGIGIFMYTRSQQTSTQQSAADSQSTQVLNNLSTDINNVDIASPESDFTTVDSELNSL